MEKTSRRRLRSASVQLGALTALAVTLSGCNQVGDDDDDCDSRPRAPRPRSLALAAYAPAVVETGATGRSAPAADVLPEQGGFGTHLAACGG